MGSDFAVAAAFAQQDEQWLPLRTQQDEQWLPLRTQQDEQWLPLRTRPICCSSVNQLRPQLCDITCRPRKTPGGIPRARRLSLRTTSVPAAVLTLPSADYLRHRPGQPAMKRRPTALASRRAA